MTVALWVNGSIDAVKGVLYIVAQLIGAFLGAVLIHLTFGDNAWQVAGYGKPSMMAGINSNIGSSSRLS